MELSRDHQSRKNTGYWSNLVEGDTAVYKAEQLDTLISTYGPKTCKAILDIGCGTSQIAGVYRQRYATPKLVCMDYDAAIIDAMRQEVGDPTIDWRVADMFKLGEWDERFDLVFMLDMLHEVYSFYGRPDDAGDPAKKLIIDHEKGLKAARKALGQVAHVLSPGGGLAITDNVLSPETGKLTIRLRHPALKPVIERFLHEYPSRRMVVTWPREDRFVIGAHDFCILTTQYNKLKSAKLDRWNVEKLEIHQYMTLAEYERTFAELGLRLHAIVGTPDSARAEWDADFELLDGAKALPQKRITLLAVRPG